MINYSISSNDKKKNKKLFPKLKNNNIDDKALMTDDVGRYSISLPKDAEIITSLIECHISKFNISNNNVIITDATAGIGGNTISFSKKFSKINSIEIDKNRYSYLRNNIDFFCLKNVNLINCDYTKIMENIIQDVVFIDPPWGGRNYKKKKNLTLHLSDISLEIICQRLKKFTKMVVLKLPLNYDIEGLVKPINANIYKYKIKKMYIIVVEF